MALNNILTTSSTRNAPISPPARRAPASLSDNLNRLISAAVVSTHFRTLLFADPVKALATGYNGEKFHLTAAEFAAVTSIRVNTVRDFAAQLLKIFQSDSTQTTHALPDHLPTRHEETRENCAVDARTQKTDNSSQQGAPTVRHLRHSLATSELYRTAQPLKKHGS